MSSRTAAASKAVREKWEEEQKLVKERKGTRDWTPEQQKDIINKGKAYDDDGKAFEGHHMKSVETYPEYQGNYKNIELLTRDEHLNAHNGNYQFPTNGYFNPITKETEDFGDSGLAPCKIIELSNPIINSGASTGEKYKSNSRSAIKSGKNKTDNLKESTFGKKCDAKTTSDRPHKVKTDTPQRKINLGKIIKSTKSVLSKTGSFLQENKDIIIPVAIEFANIAIPIATTVINNHISKNSTSTSKSPSTSSKVGTSYEEKITSSKSNSTIPSERSYPETHASPRLHQVKDYTRYRNGKKEHVSSYTRGVKKD